MKFVFAGFMSVGCALVASGITHDVAWRITAGGFAIALSYMQLWDQTQR